MCSQAAAIQVTPTRINLANDAPIATLNLSNKASTSTMLQIQTTHWSQTDGQDVYVTSNDLIVSPPIMTIDPGKSQLIRIALRKNGVPHSEEETFRIFVQEIPKYHPANTPGVEFALRFGIPVFISPTVSVTHTLQWKTKRLSDNNLQLSVINLSNTHIQVTHLNIINPDTHKTLASQDVFVYLLPHQSKKWAFKLNATPNKNAEVSANTDWGVLSTNISL